MQRAASQGNDSTPQPPRPPNPTTAVLQAREKAATYLEEREATERSSVLRGLLVLILLVLLVSVISAGVHRAFFTGWWRQW